MFCPCIRYDSQVSSLSFHMMSHILVHLSVINTSINYVFVNYRQAAIGIARLCKPAYHSNIKRQESIQRMISAITNHPYMVYGTKGFCTVLMETMAGLVIGKRGAAGVYISGIVGEGLGCAVKIDDGSMGPQYNVTMKFLLWACNYLRRKYSENQQENNSPIDIDRFSSLVHNSALSNFLLTPSINYMGLNVGCLECIDSIFSESI